MKLRILICTLLLLLQASCTPRSFWLTEPYYECKTIDDTLCVYSHVKIPVKDIESVRAQAKAHPDKVWDIQGPFLPIKK